MKRDNSFPSQLGFERKWGLWAEETQLELVINGSALRPGQQRETRSRQSPKPQV